MRTLLIIILAIFLYSCDKEDVKPSANISSIKDTVAVFKLWGTANKEVTISFIQGGRTWSKAIQYETDYTYSNPLIVYLNINGVKSTECFTIKAENGSGTGCNIRFVDKTNQVETDGFFGTLIQ